MKTVTAILSLLAFATIAAAQNPDASKWMCRNLADSGGFTYQGETVFGTQACRPITQAAATISPSTPKQEAKIVSVSASASTSEVTPTPQPAPTAVSSSKSADSPSEPGMYMVTSAGFTKILGQILDFKRSGSLLASDVTLHLKSSKENIQLLGAHAQTLTSSIPEFYFIPAKQEADAGVNAGDFILVHLEEKKERRQVEVGAEGVGRASKGIALTHQVQLSRFEVKPGVYKIAPAVGLARGEYGLYLSRGEGMAAYIYDFSVQ